MADLERVVAEPTPPTDGVADVGSNVTPPLDGGEVLALASGPARAVAASATSPYDTFLSYVGVAAVLGTTAATVLAVAFGPAPYSLAESRWLRSTAGSLIEPADRLALGSWYALTLALAFGGSRLVGRSGRRARVPVRRVKPVGDGLLLLTASVVVLGLVWSTDPSQLWRGIPLVALPIGWLLAAALIEGTLRSRSQARVVTLALTALALAVAVPAWLQLPAALNDPYHFRFSAEEVSSVAAGHFPLGDFAPQYSVLLPYLFAVPIALSPGHAPVIVVAGMLALQAVALCAAVALPTLLGGRRFLAPALVVVLPMVFVPLTNGSSVASYFQGMPLRDVLPIVTIVVAFLVLRRRADVAWQRPWPMVALGFASGVAALNNPDFGLAAAAAAVITVLLTQTGPRPMLRAATLLAGGFVAVFAGYALAGWLRGTPVDWSAWLAFQSIFGSTGLYNVPMDAFGLHVVLVSLFVGASATGFVLVRRSLRRGARCFAHRQGLLIALVGGWSMLCLPYLAGRSLPPTYVGGMGFNAVVVVACLLLASRAWRAARALPSSQRRTRALVPLVMAIGAAVSAFWMAPEPSAHIQALSAVENPGMPIGVGEEISRFHRVIPVDDAPPLPTLRKVTIAQALPFASMLELTYGLPSAAVSTSPDYAEVSGWFSSRQCRSEWPTDTEYLLVRALTADALREDPSCADYVDWSSAFRYEDPVIDDPGSDLILLPRLAAR